MRRQPRSTHGNTRGMSTDSLAGCRAACKDIDEVRADSHATITDIRKVLANSHTALTAQDILDVPAGSRAALIDIHEVRADSAQH